MPETLNLKVYNPYPFNVPLKDLKFGIAYLDNYKKVQEINTIVASPVKKEKTALTAKDTTYFELTYPDSKIKDPAYFRIVISENNLYFGLNGQPIPIKE